MKHTHKNTPNHSNIETLHSVILIVYHIHKLSDSSMILLTLYETVSLIYSFEFHVLKGNYRSITTPRQLANRTEGQCCDLSPGTCCFANELATALPFFSTLQCTPQGTHKNTNKCTVPLTNTACSTEIANLAPFCFEKNNNDKNQ